MVWEDHFFPEIVDPETGAVLPDGELGELVFTSLRKKPCRSSGTARAIGQGCFLLRRGRCGEWRR